MCSVPPDNTVHSSSRDGNFEIFVMDADGGNQTQITITEETENSGAALFDSTDQFLGRLKPKY
jgi:Tol biopolymer transport system component